MTPIQETANAFLMIPPVCVLIAHFMAAPGLRIGATLATASLICVVSIAYHMHAAKRTPGEARDTDLRRLDQSVQLLSAGVMSWVYSQSLAYVCAVAVLWLLPSIFAIWVGPTRSDGKRWHSVSVSALFPFAAMLWRGMLRDAVAIFATWGVGVFFFWPFVNERLCGGWGHAIFHAALTPLSHAVCVSLRREVVAAV